MPYETLRFIHAARALVDHPLEGTGPIGSDLRGLVRGATTQAFRRVVAECLEHDVDFLLLTGDALDQSDFSVKARVELREGFEQLEDGGIQVFLVPGSRDPAPVWEDFPELPGNVSIFRPETDDPVAVLRDGAVIASIRALGWRQSWFSWEGEESHTDRPRNSAHETAGNESAKIESTRTDDDELESLIHESDDPELDDDFDESPNASDHNAHTAPVKHESHREIRRVQSPAELRPNHFAIAIVRDGIDQPSSDPQADYLALTGGRERHTTKGGDWLLHFPGGTQGISSDEVGLHGCSMVDLDSDGVIRCRFLPTSPVRWENVDIEVDAATTFEQLVQRMKLAAHKTCGIEERSAVEFTEDDDDSTASHLSEQLHAQACFFRWTIRGNGSLFDSLLEDSYQSELIDWLDADAAWPLDIPRLHRFRMVAAEPVVARTANDDDEQLDVPTEFFWRVDQAEPLGKVAWSDLGQEGVEQQERLRRVHAATSRCDAAVVFGLARRRGWNWFRSVRS